ncbi:hypothetical protein [Aeromonas caviae]|uniref:hypothetical protein n=1 Tax=Aeromonas caviae TaxID=648 RepID=UPI002B4711D4|nr:hypothetical protein [Aeromonas caviae]
MQEQLSDIATYNGFTQDSSIAAIAAAIMCEGMWIEYFPDIFERREYACIASQVVVILLIEGDEDVNPHDEYLGKVRTSIPRKKNENFSHLISMGYQ